MFVDEAKIWVKGGDGGNGVVAFRREKFVPKGGPSGGTAGRGGNVYLIVDPHLSTLIEFKYRVHFKAQRGKHGQGDNKTGANGKDFYIRVPPGTVVKDCENDEVLLELIFPGQKALVARGGRGGRGNLAFANSRRRAPKFAEKGEQGETRWLKLELKLLADVALIGYPNAGKSSFLSFVSAAKPKIAPYPFTTLSPVLGVVRYKEQELVFAEIPGLIEGAHKGKGLGKEFLRHIERTRLLIHLVDLTEISPQSPLERVYIIQDELKNHNPQLLLLPQIILGNKIDIPQARDNIEIFRNAVNSYLSFPVYFVSTATGEGIEELIPKIFSICPKKEFPPVQTETLYLPAPPPKPIEVKVKEGKFIVTGGNLEQQISRFDLENKEVLYYLYDYFKYIGLIENLEKNGIKEGDIVSIGEMEFTYIPY